MKTITLTDSEARMFASLLCQAGDQMGNNGCNDFDMSEFGATVGEMRALAQEYHRGNGDPEEADALTDKQLPYALGDWLLLRVLEKRIRNA